MRFKRVYDTDFIVISEIDYKSYKQGLKANINRLFSYELNTLCKIMINDKRLEMLFSYYMLYDKSVDFVGGGKARKTCKKDYSNLIAYNEFNNALDTEMQMINTDSVLVCKYRNVRNRFKGFDNKIMLDTYIAFDNKFLLCEVNPFLSKNDMLHFAYMYLKK